MELSKEEIAEFNQALDSNGQESKGGRSKQVRSYDFLRPDKLSKAHLRVLQSLMSGLERSWSTTISAALKTTAEVTLGSLEQADWNAYCESLPERCLMVRFSMGKLNTQGFLDMPLELLLVMVDRLAGGDGRMYGEPRSLTQIEQRMISHILDGLAVDFVSAWRPVVALDVSVAGMCSSADDIEISPEEMLLIVGFNWSIFGSQYKISFAIPVNALDSIRDLLTPEHWMEGRMSAAKANGWPMAAVLTSIPVVSSVELGRARVSMHDAIGLSVGDVIRLNRLARDPLDVYVQGEVKFYGQPGLVGNRLAVQIIEHAQEMIQPPPAQETADEQTDTEVKPDGG